MATCLPVTEGLAKVVRHSWDAVVIGAGTTGATAAAQLLREGYRTLLVERTSFPRPKVCGGCLSEVGVHGLGLVGLGPALERTRPAVIDRCRIVLEGRTTTLPIPPSTVVDRAALDQSLAHQIGLLGGGFLESTAAVVAPDDRVHLSQGTTEGVIEPKIVVVADGLQGTSLAQRPEFGWSVRRGSYLGMGTVLDFDSGPRDREAITMYSSSEGYLGFAPLAEGRWVVAAALAPEAIRRHGRTSAVARLLVCNGASADWLEGAPWHGTAPLTRHRNCAARGRTLVIGDAFRYLEPFTGEGMSWGIRTALALPAIAADIIAQREVDRRWRRQCRHLLRRRTAICRAVSYASRHPRLFRAVLRLGRSPATGSWLRRRLRWSMT